MVVIGCFFCFCWGEGWNGWSLPRKAIKSVGESERERERENKLNVHSSDIHNIE